LFYRLNVFPIELPALRDRQGDIKLLARHFLNQANQEYGASAVFDPDAMKFLENYNWPGNIRQLENIVKRAVLLADKNRFISSDLINHIIAEERGIILKDAINETDIHTQYKAPTKTPKAELPTPPPPREPAYFDSAQTTHRNVAPYPESLLHDDSKRAYWRVSENEKERLLNALHAAHGNKTRAAMLLNMTPRQFGYRLKKLDLE
jgi:Nif-specific regulatory protein